MRLFILYFLSLAVPLQGQELNCKEEVQKVFNTIVSSIGNNSLYPPRLEFSSENSSVAFINDGIIYVEEKVIHLFCNNPNFKDLISYVLAHELAHHYLNHSWMSQSGLGYSSSIGRFIDDNSITYSIEQRKLAESQADLFGGFFGKISGYKTLMFAEKALESIYESYELPSKIPGYPDYFERVEIINSRIERSNDLAEIFEIGNVMLHAKQYEIAKYSYELILKNGFNSREIYNNLGLAYLLYGLSVSEGRISKILFPVSIDYSTRANISDTRSSSLLENPEEMFQKALDHFNRSKDLDPDYNKASMNRLISEFLLSPTYESRQALITKYQNQLPEEFLIDLEVINMITFSKSLKKARKLSRGGTIISQQNLSQNIVESVDQDMILDQLGLSFMDLISLDFDRIAESSIKKGYLNNFVVYETKGLYTIKLPKDYLRNNNSSTLKENCLTINNEDYIVYLLN